MCQGSVRRVEGWGNLSGECEKGGGLGEFVRGVCE